MLGGLTATISRVEVGAFQMRADKWTALGFYVLAHDFQRPADSLWGIGHGRAQAAGKALPQQKRAQIAQRLGLGIHHIAAVAAVQVQVDEARQRVTVVRIQPTVARQRRNFPSAGDGGNATALNEQAVPVQEAVSLPDAAVGD